MTITDLATDTVAETIDLLDDDPDAKAETALDAGFYLVTVTAQKNLLTAASGADIAVWSDVLHVYNGLTTSVKLADADFAYSSNISGVWVNGDKVTPETDGSFTYKLPAAAADDKITIALTGSTPGAVFIPADGKDTLSGALGELPMVFADYEEDLTATTTEWTITEEGAYTLTITPWPLDEATLSFRNDDIQLMKVTFYDNADDKNQLGEIVEVPADTTVPANKFPNNAMSGWTINSWKTESGAAFTATTVVTADIDVFVNAKTYTGGKTFVIDDPELEVSPGGTHGTWNGANTPASGKSSSFLIKSGGVRFGWADVDDPEFDIDDYDFVTVEFTASSVADIVYKHYGNSVDYPLHNGGIVNGTGTFTFAIRQATSPGFAIQKWQAGTMDTTITFTKIIFTEGKRYNVDFSLGDYNGTDYNGPDAVPTAIQVVFDVPLVTLPAAPHWADKTVSFTGWYLGATSVATTTVVTEAFEDGTITAHWGPRTARTPITIDFTANAPVTRAEATLSDTSASGFTLTYAESGNNINYGNVYAWFDYTFTGGVKLSDFDKVTFTYNGLAGDVGSKSIIFMAGTSAQIGGYLGSPADFQLGAPTSVGSGSSNITVVIGDRALTVGDTVRFGFYIHASNMGSNVATSYSIANVVFAQDE